MSNVYCGKARRRRMVDSFAAPAPQAQAAGNIAGQSSLSGDSDVAQQNRQISERFLKGVDAIAAGAASQPDFDFKGRKQDEAEGVFKNPAAISPAFDPCR